MNSYGIGMSGQQYLNSGSERTMSLIRHQYATGLRDLGDRDWLLIIRGASKKKILLYKWSKRFF